MAEKFYCTEAVEDYAEAGTLDNGIEIAVTEEEMGSQCVYLSTTRAREFAAKIVALADKIEESESKVEPPKSVELGPDVFPDYETRLRDDFAKIAFAEMIKDQDNTLESVAWVAFRGADAMMAARKKVEK